MAGGSAASTGDLEFSFLQPITIEVKFNDAQLLHLDASQMAIHQWDEAQGTWQPLTTTVDMVNHLATAYTQVPGTFQLQAPLACTGDPLEPDDDYYRAAAAPVNSGPVVRALDISEDEDWFQLSALTGNTYTIQTNNLAAGVDTIVTVLDGDLNSLATDDNGGGGTASRLEWQPPHDGTYFIRVTGSAGSAYGCDAAYGLQVQVPPTSLTLQYSGAISYSTCGGWQPFTKPTMDLLPGIYPFSFDGHGAELRVSSPTMASSVAVLKLLDSNGQGLASGTAEYDDNGWQAIPGSTGDSGVLVAALPGLKPNATFRMTYEGTFQEKTQDIASDSYVTFQLQGISEVALAGPATGVIDASYTFTATVSPISATLPITYVWQASGQEPVTHAAVSNLVDTADLTWSITGTQTVMVTATNALGTVSGTHTLTLYAPPEAGFVATPLSGVAPLTVSFTNTTTGDYTALSWDFGDGSPTSAEANPTHVYAATGAYTVTLTASGPGGSDAKTKASYITAIAPVAADFTATPLSGVAPLEVTFTNGTTGDYTTSEWDFGDGVTSTLASPIHTYAAPGVYTVTLTASGLGGSDTETKASYITVQAALFSATPTSGAAPLTVVFTSQSTCVGIWCSTTWHFGDGEVEMYLYPDHNQPVSHTYSAPGRYTVTMEWFDDATSEGGSEVKPDYITVTGADFTATPVSGVAPLSVAFNNTSIGDYAAYTWDFGDGSPTSAEASPTHVYATSGAYTVTLTASGPGGSDTETKASYITVQDAAPLTGVNVNLLDVLRGLLAWGGYESDGELGILFDAWEGTM